MKQLLRIIIGVPLCPFPLLLGTWIWLWEEGMDWRQEVGATTWWIASGQWNKLPE